MDLNATKIDPQELGKLILSLQDEIKIIKLQLENLPGYSVGRLHAMRLLNFRWGTSTSVVVQTGTWKDFSKSWRKKLVAC